MSFPRLTSLEFLTVGLTSSQIKIERNLTDNGVLQPSNGLDFSGLRRFKIFGDSNLMPLTDEDLFFISRTAVNLEEIHITGATSVTIKGIFIIIYFSLPPPPITNRVRVTLYTDPSYNRCCRIGRCLFPDAQACRVQAPL